MHHISSEGCGLPHWSSPSSEICLPNVVNIHCLEFLHGKQLFDTNNPSEKAHVKAVHPVVCTSSSKTKTTIKKLPKRNFILTQTRSRRGRGLCRMFSISVRISKTPWRVCVAPSSVKGKHKISEKKFRLKEHKTWSKQMGARWTSLYCKISCVVAAWRVCAHLAPIPLKWASAFDADEFILGTSCFWLISNKTPKH